MVEIKIAPVANYLDQVARNHARILNHLELLEKKIKIGGQLGLIATDDIPAELVESNLSLLDQLQKGSIPLPSTLERLGQNIGLTVAEVEHLLDSIIAIGHLEFHPTDFCDHRCIGCYYKDKGDDVLPFPFVAKILQRYKPRSVVLVGGGEPTFYHYQQQVFSDLVSEIKRFNPKIQIGLVTKGTFIPPGNWQEQIDWTRLSLDAAAPETFLETKGKDGFQQVLNNFITYLRGPIPNVGIGFLYWSRNIAEATTVPRLIYALVNRVDPRLLVKSNIQYRPMRPGVDSPEKVRKNHVHESMICSAQQVEKATREFEEVILADQPVGRYIQNHTNWSKVSEGNGLRRGQPFAYCYYSLLFKIFRPTGEVYPCFVRVSDPDYLIGNFLEETDAEHRKIALLSYLFFNKARLFCDPEKCRLSWLNNIAERGYKDRGLKPTGAAASSYFF
ncbi:MAG: radical SAM protein [Candidatus Margulisbacteria bacterium]|nr:radical SAM protein [Candidatus Margulisiibacteriota bacterium]MBU1617577.1 radical SAM protein [Candidatus Margulisiibacteriota bacterium]